MAHVFANPIYGGQDPFVCRGDDAYYGVAETAGAGAIEVYRTERLTRRGSSRVVYRAQESGESSAELWAPEIWRFGGKWYVYYAGASNPGQKYWNTHRTFVLEADEPFGPYRPPVKLELKVNGKEQMAIDASVLQLAEDRYVIFYMGRDEERRLNCLYMAGMDSPTHVCTQPVLLSQPELPWEGDINEGPFPIYRNGRVSLLYAANAAHLPDYCLGLLVCGDVDDILDPASWTKLDEPLLTRSGAVIGPGHACIVPSPDGTEDWLVYHSKFDHDYTLPGGWNRVVNLLRLRWKDDVIPVFDKPHQPGEPVPAPSGEPDYVPGEDTDIRLSCRSLEQFDAYTYSRGRSVWATGDSIRIDGRVWPEFGDKLILAEKVYGDCRIELSFASLSPEGEAGLLFGVTLPGAGRCRWRGYGLFADRPGHVRLICCDGKKISILRDAQAAGGGGWKLSVKVSGSSITAYCGEEPLFGYDVKSAVKGQIGIGTLGGDAAFTKLRISEVQR